MDPKIKISGIHHITAIASSAAENVAFYSDVLGLRLVKKTVNFDDPNTYHLYYGDAEGSPGTILTFFPWDQASSGKSGAGVVTSTAFSIPIDAVGFWRDRLRNHGIDSKETERFGERVIQFMDPHGLSLELVASPAADSIPLWKSSPIPHDHCILGIYSATSVLRSIEDTRSLLTDLMGMTLLDNDSNRYRFKMESSNTSDGNLYDVIVDPHAEKGRQGGGTVHHIAFRTSTHDEQKYWQHLLIERGFSVTPIRDRKYFKSIYFHEPGGVLFEIATDSPGFMVDEPFERLGQNLKLPDQYESMRNEIESHLPELPATEIAVN